MAGKGSLGGLFRETVAGAFRWAGGHLSNLKSKFVQTAEERIERSDAKLQRMHELQMQREAEAEAFRRRNPGAGDEQVAKHLSKKGLIEPKTTLEEGADSALKTSFNLVKIAGVVAVPAFLATDFNAGQDWNPSVTARVADALTGGAYGSAFKRDDGTEFDIGPILARRVEAIRRDPDRKAEFLKNSGNGFSPMREYYFYLDERNSNNVKTKKSAARDTELNDLQTSTDVAMATNQKIRSCLSTTEKTLEQCRAEAVRTVAPALEK